MDGKNKSKFQTKSQWGLMGAISAAIAASVCCLGPLILVGLGFSGAWIGSLSAFERYRSLFMLITFGFLAFAFYKVYSKPKADCCATDSYCANPKADKINPSTSLRVDAESFGKLRIPLDRIIPSEVEGRAKRVERINKIALWGVTIFVAGMLMAPNVIGAFASKPASTQALTTEQVVLNVKGMTCAACSVTVSKSLKRVDGVQEANVTLTPPEAVVTFDPAKVKVEQLIEATKNVGYPTSVKGGN